MMLLFSGSGVFRYDIVLCFYQCRGYMDGAGAGAGAGAGDGVFDC